MHYGSDLKPDVIGADTARRRLGSGVAGTYSEDDDECVNPRERSKRKCVKRLNWVWDKVTAALWVAICVAMIYWTNFFRVIWESPLVNRPYFHFALACLSFNMSLLAYLAIWCSCVRGIDDPWDTLYPKSMYVMGIVALLTFVLFNAALWPVWGFLVPFMQLVFFLGFINSGHFLPNGTLGSLLMFVIFIGAFFTSELIPHEGLAHYTPRPTVVKHL